MAPAIRAAKLTHPGRTRDTNEDFCELRVPAQPDEMLKKGILCVVTDGMGGHEGGKAASQWAATIALERYYSDKSDDVSSSLLEAVQAANVEVREMAARNHWSSVGTTLVGAVVRGRELTVANVGDSRAYLIRGKSICQLTKDHTWVQEQVEAGLMTPEQAAVDPRRNALTRSLGSRPEVNPDIFRHNLEEGDRLVLCSDGLTGPSCGSRPVKEQEILEITSRYPEPKEAARRLIDLANRRGGLDNISVIVLNFGRSSRVPAASPGPRLAAAGLVGLAGLAYGAFSFFSASSAPITSGLSPTPAAAVLTSLASPAVEPVSAVSLVEATPTATAAAMPWSPTSTIAPTFTSVPPTHTLVPTATPPPSWAVEGTATPALESTAAWPGGMPATTPPTNTPTPDQPQPSPPPSGNRPQPTAPPSGDQPPLPQLPPDGQPQPTRPASGDPPQPKVEPPGQVNKVEPARPAPKTEPPGQASKSESPGSKPK